ncbi:Retrovirus-related Pol polyprotein from transposon [Smittium culicis]|uniref:Retrovirus-related Pol polyprotein from transposon n=1 Tax=Smittium culicis TaxID=133412 RepID=A0A1R1X4F7_9FUNG|nr:Retrovirus-related Pol polyprotein from transposon [Smittium culicis]
MNALKKMILEAPMLLKPDFSKNFVLSTEASSFAIGAMLEQQNDDGSLAPVAYYSKKLKDVETRYSAYEREALAVVSAVKHFRCYLWNNEFDVYTDNSAVSRLYNLSEPTGRVARWISFLSEFRINLKHRKGKDTG